MTIAPTHFSLGTRTEYRFPSLSDRARDLLLLAIGVQIAFLIPSAIAYAVDERLLNDVSVWSKPVKFQLSIILTLGTAALLLPLLDEAARATRTVRGASFAMAISSTLEIIYIVIQAARGRASHFNEATPLEAMLYPVMGVGAVSIVAGAFVIGWVIWRHGRTDVGEGLRSGAAWGLMIGAVLTVVTAGVMSSGAIAEPGHWVGGIRSDANGLFLVGWSRTGGDLRVPHFFATHMMQGLPILGLLLDRFAPGRARIGIWVGAAAGVLIVAATFIQAANGVPFL
ncbi:hypothetical protein [Rhizobium sp. LjRoot254]|uniref:hypothetical protein n=1 Tax=Rhizobium sp. LjRoot254 TaxID=3342297 RepID=UPI003ECF8AC6